MKTLIDHISQYAAYHRDPRNIATHVIGVPMIVMAVVVLLSRPEFALFGWGMNPAIVVAIAVGLFYLLLDLRFAVVMIAIFVIMLASGKMLAAQSSMVWLGTGISLFIVGWVIQFIGHYYEGRKPAFVDDLVGLFIGPLFLLVKLAFAFGLRLEVQREVQARISNSVSYSNQQTMHFDPQIDA